jgi:isopenicillin-N epimerase
MKEHFLLRPDVTFLNHGSYGACPRPVFEVYQGWQLEMEYQPLDFFVRHALPLLRSARGRLADYLHTLPDNLVFVPNTTTGVNIVARSLKLQPGDEILATDHEYGAVDRTWRFICGKTGAVYVRQPIPLPLASAAQFVETFWQNVTPRTKVICISHITSVTALIFPLRTLLRRARAQGILTIVDGAHAPGQIPLDLSDLDPDFYAGNCHKWLCSPKGAAFLYARPAVQNLVEPLVVSWGYEPVAEWDTGNPQFVSWLEWQGTRDLAAYLSVPAALDFQAANNWAERQQICHRLLTDTLYEISDLTGLPLHYPPGQEWDWYRQFAVAPLGVAPARVRELYNRLWEDYRIEIPIVVWGDQTFVRPSIQVYNTPDDTARLLAALRELLPAFARNT